MDFITRVMLAFFVAGAPLLVIEFVSRRHALRPETARKLVHVGSCLAACALPSLVGLHMTALIAGCFLVFMLALRRRRYWHSLYRIERSSLGELSFPLGVVTAALVAHTVGIFIVAMLVMGLADTMAAAVGQKYGRRHLFGGPKTVVGSLACLGVSLGICLIAASLGVVDIKHGLIAAIFVTLAEALTPNGVDNLMMPLLATIVLN